MIGIRREDKNAWERRAPLTPDHVAELVDDRGVSFTVEPSDRRVFPDLDYRMAGATVSPDLSGCSVILGIKEIPPEKLLAGKAYVYFSHTTKGQAANMPALARLLELGCTLMDYELVLDDGRRLIAFGKHAGYAGMIDCLWALGRRLAAEGHVTPLESVRLAHDYAGLDEATHHVSRVGERIRHTGLPPGLRPVVFGFTGSGNVATGAQEIFDRLPTQELLPDELAAVARDPERPRSVLYKVRFGRRDRFERIEGGPVDLDELRRHPERYRSAMHRWLPELTVLVNGAYWSPGQPRLVTIEHLRELWSRNELPKLRVIADIACDVDGGIEATARVTTPGDPVYVFELPEGRVRDGIEGAGPVILAVDNLSCQLPVESSSHFGDGLLRFVPALARCDFGAGLDELALPEELRRAVIAHRGRLAPSFGRLERHLS